MTLAASPPLRTAPDLRWPVCLAVLALACVVPLFAGNYVLHAFIIAFIFLLPAQGLNLLVGYTGLLSLAQAAFFGIGAYVGGLAATVWNPPLYATLVLGGLVAGLLALPLGVPALRLRSTSFVMCTLGFVVIGQAIAKNWTSVTRGDMGLSGIPRAHLGLMPRSLVIAGPHAYYYLALAVAVLSTVVMVLLVRSAAGRNMVAIRENETLAESLGVPVWRYKLTVFVISAVFAGIGGALYAHYLTIVSPLTFQLSYSTMILIIVLAGGPGTISGPVIGSLLFVGLTEALRVAPELRMIGYGLCLIALVFYFPGGFTPLIARVSARLEGRP